MNAAPDHSTLTAPPPPKPAPAPRRRRMPALLIGLVAVIAAGLALRAVVAANSPAEPAPVQAVAAAPRDITALGQVLPQGDFVLVAGPTGQDAGRIAEVRVATGDLVTEGQVLAVLDTAPVLAARLAEAQANEALKEGALQARIADLDAEEGQLANEVDMLRAALGKAQHELDNMIRLRDSGLYEDTALTNLQFDVQSATFSLQSREIALERSRLRTASGQRLDEMLAAAEHQAAVAARERAEADYAKAMITAPSAGRVMQIYAKVGEQVDSATGFAMMGDTSRMQIRTEVYETDVAALRPGLISRATSPALDDTLIGQVQSIGVRIQDQSILSTDPAAIVDARVVEVWILLDEPSSALARDLSGLQVMVSIDPEEAADA